MSAYLTQLLARALRPSTSEAAASVRPRPRSRFEPEGPDIATDQAPATEASTAEARDAQARGARLLAPMPADESTRPSPPPPRETLAPEARPRLDAVERYVDAARPAERRSPPPRLAAATASPSLSPTPPPAAALSPKPTAEALPPAAAPRRSAPELPMLNVAPSALRTIRSDSPSPGPAAAPSAARLHLSEASETNPARPSRTLAPAPDAAGEQGRPSSPTPLRPQIEAELPAQTERPHGAQAAASPTIRVTIGRVEVHTPPPPGPARPAPTPRQPALSLDAYLSQRDARGDGR